MTEEEYKYDQFGRMKFHPEVHFRHNYPYCEEEKAYIVQQHKQKHVKTLAVELGRTEGSVQTLITSVKKKGQYESLQQTNTSFFIEEMGTWQE